jgi:hypothetical protein
VNLYFCIAALTPTSLSMIGGTVVTDRGLGDKVEVVEGLILIHSPLAPSSSHRS